MRVPLCRMPNMFFSLLHAKNIDPFYQIVGGRIFKKFNHCPLLAQGLPHMCFVLVSFFKSAMFLTNTFSSNQLCFDEAVQVRIQSCVRPCLHIFHTSEYTLHEVNFELRMTSIESFTKY